jgi:hypothetical protein
MKKILLLSGVLLAFSASMALAGGVNLAWGTDCWPGNAITNKTFACNSNSGANTMTASYEVSNDIPDFVGISSVIDIQATTTLPAWWQYFNAGACRQSNLSPNANFTSSPGTCFDVFQGNANGGITAYQTSSTVPPGPYGPNAARLKLAFALAAPTDLPPATETYGFSATFNNGKTVGLGSCAGCATQVTLVLNNVHAAGLSGQAEDLSGPINNGCLTWQAATGGVPCNATPTANKTWGQVKSLYR